MSGFRAKILLCAGLCAGMAGSASAQTKLSYGTYLPPTHVNNTVGIEPMVKRLEQESGGKLTVEIFPGGSVAKATAAVDSIRDGIVTAGMIVDTYVPKQLPHSFLITELALLGRNSVVMSGATNEFNLVACKECLADQKKSGIISMAHYSTAPYTLMCKADLRSIADFKGKKIRSAGAYSIMFKAFGMVPVNVTSDETYEAMQRGQVDCTMGADSWLKSYTLWDVAKNVLATTIGTYHGGLLWAMNAETYAELPAEQKAMLKKNMPILAADVTFGYLQESRDVHSGWPAKRASSSTRPMRPGTASTRPISRTRWRGSRKKARSAACRTPIELVDRYLELVEEMGEDRRRGDQGRQAEVRRGAQPRSLQQGFVVTGSGTGVSAGAMRPCRWLAAVAAGGHLSLGRRNRRSGDDAACLCRCHHEGGPEPADHGNAGDRFLYLHGGLHLPAAGPCAALAHADHRRGLHAEIWRRKRTCGSTSPPRS